MRIFIIWLFLIIGYMLFLDEAAKGDEKVARLRLERDIAKDSYYVCLNAIDNLRLEIECIRSRITWERVELKNS